MSLTYFNIIFQLSTLRKQFLHLIFEQLPPWSNATLNLFCSRVKTHFWVEEAFKRRVILRVSTYFWSWSVSSKNEPGAARAGMTANWFFPPCYSTVTKWSVFNGFIFYFGWNHHPNRQLPPGFSFPFPDTCFESIFTPQKHCACFVFSSPSGPGSALAQTGIKLPVWI